MFQYEPFRDSTEYLNDGETLRARLAEDGYLFLRGLLPRQPVLDVRARLLNKAAEGGWLAPDSPIAAGAANSAAACKDPEPRYMSVFRGLWSDEALHRLRIDPRVIALFERIFAERALAHPMFVQRNIFPQSDGFDFTTGIHQDRVHIGGATSYAMWMPLGDCPREMGTLAVAAGSHTTGILPTKVGSGAGGMDIAVPIPGTWVTGDFEAGDALIFQDVTVHKALPNRTRSIRMSFDARYQKLSEPMADVNLMPYAGCGSWDEVYAGWSSREGQYYWKDLPITIVPLDRSHYERRDAMAFEMAEAGDRGARDAILRIIQRDPLPEKRERAEKLLGAAGRRLTTKRTAAFGRVEVWRGGCRSNISVAAPFVWRCLTGSTLAPSPHPAHRTGHADLPHPALGQNITPSPTARRAQVGSDVRARSARRGARVDRPRPCVA